MKFSTANILIIVGGCLILAPLAFLYLCYRLASQVLSEAISHGLQWEKVNLHPLPPDYYVSIWIITGLLCIGIGVYLASEGKNKEVVSDFPTLDLS